MRQASDSTKVRRLSAENTQLRRTIHSLTVERHNWGKLARKAERDAEDWKQRCDKLIALVGAK